MKFLFVLALVVTNLYAGPSPEQLSKLRSCTNFLSFDSLYLYSGTGAYKRGVEEPREAIPGRLDLVSLDESHPDKVIATLDGPMSIVRKENILYVLTYSGLEIYDLNNFDRLGNFETFSLNQPKQYRQHSRSMVLWNDLLFIAQGRLGFSVFDTKQNKIIIQRPLLADQLPLESEFMDVTIAGGKIVFAASSFSMPEHGHAFRGLVIVNPISFKTEKQLDILDPGIENIFVSGSKLFANYGPVMWSFPLEEIMAGNKAVSHNNIPIDLNKGNFVGKGIAEGANFYSCYNQRGSGPGKPSKRIATKFDDFLK